MVLSFELKFETDNSFVPSLVGWFEYLRNVESLTTEQLFLCSLLYSSKIGFPLNVTFKDVIDTLKQCNFDYNELKYHYSGSNV